MSSSDSVFHAPLSPDLMKVGGYSSHLPWGRLSVFLLSCRSKGVLFRRVTTTERAASFDCFREVESDMAAGSFVGVESRVRSPSRHRRFPTGRVAIVAWQDGNTGRP